MTEYNEFIVYNEDGIEIGEVYILSKTEIPSFQEMPKELEINGFIYHIET